MAFIVRMRGQVQGDITLCIPCVMRASYGLAAGQDVIINADIDLNLGGSV